jgi:hypothetical protein
MMIVGPLTNFPSSILTSKGVNPRLLIVIGASVMIFGIIFSGQIVESSLAFVIVFATAFGFSGFFYVTILHRGWLYFPGYEGVVSGIVIAGFGIGGFIFTTLVDGWINPDNVPSQHYDKDDHTSKPFPPENLDLKTLMPIALTRLGLSQMILVLLSIVLFRDISKKESKFATAKNLAEELRDTLIERNIEYSKSETGNWAIRDSRMESEITVKAVNVNPSLRIESFSKTTSRSDTLATIENQSMEVNLAEERKEDIYLAQSLHENP